MFGGSSRSSWNLCVLVPRMWNSTTAPEKSLAVSQSLWYILDLIISLQVIYPRNKNIHPGKDLIKYVPSSCAHNSPEWNATCVSVTIRATCMHACRFTKGRAADICVQWHGQIPKYYSEWKKEGTKSTSFHLNHRKSKVRQMSPWWQK